MTMETDEKPEGIILPGPGSTPPPEDPPTDEGGEGDGEPEPDWITGFFIGLDKSGKFIGITNLEDVSFNLFRPLLSMDELWRGCMEVAKDVEQVQQANKIIAMQERHAQIKREAQTNAAIAAQIGDLKGGNN